MADRRRLNKEIKNRLDSLAGNALPALKEMAGLCADGLTGLASLCGRAQDAAPAAGDSAGAAAGENTGAAAGPGSGAPVAAEAGTAEAPVRAENRGTITVDGTDDRALFDYYKADLSQVDSRFNRSLSAFAMASLTADPHGETYREAGDYAVLTNDGEIRMNMGELLRRFGPDMTAPGDMENLPDGKQGIREGSGKKYLTLMLWGMLGGCQSTLVNNGKIITECDTDNPEGTESVFTHPMYVYHRSAMINNGEVLVRGRGNRGINPRGLTSQKNDLSVVNNGTIVIDVENSYLTRALTVAGFGSTIVNRGLVSGRSGGTVFGAGHSGSSTLINEGTVDVTTMGVVPAEKIGVLATFASVAGAYGLSAAGPDYMMEKLFEKFGVRNWKGEGIVNKGVVKAAVQDAGAADPGSVAAGILLLDSHVPYNGWYTVGNTGVIRTASDLSHCGENNRFFRRAELVVNSVHMPEKTFPARIRIREWATELRDFERCGDLILARSDSEDPVTLCLEDAELILRPAENYDAGTAYRVSPETLAAPMGAPTLEEAGVQVEGVEYLRFRAEMPDFVVPFVEETARGDYQVSLKPADDPEARRRMLSAAAMGPVDFIRLNMDELDRMLGDAEAPDWSVEAYQSFHSRRDGLKGRLKGIAGRRDVGPGSLLRAGVHGACARDRAAGGIYGGTSRMRAAMDGVHFSLADGTLRAQGTRFRTAGGTDFALHTDTGICLDGRADGKLDGFYVSAQLSGHKRLGNERRLRAEAGISLLKFNRGTGVDWSFKEEPLPGYRMETGSVKSVRGNFRLGYKRSFKGGRDGRAAFSLEGSAALFDRGVGLRMLGTQSGETVREDPLRICVDVSVRRRVGGRMLKISFHGGLGRNCRHTGVRFALTPDRQSVQKQPGGSADRA